MINRLRKNFILLSLSVVATVILLIVAGIDVANYMTMRKNADAVILFLENRSDQQMDPPPMERNGEMPDREREDVPRDVPLETAFSARYFTIETNKDGGILSYNLEKVAFVSSNDLTEYLSQAKNKKGFSGNYRYKKVETAEGIHYIFLDCEKELTSTRMFIITSAIIVAGGLAVIALLIIFLSKKVLAPVEESYKKQKRFITDAGHELKTPLTVISANAELLELDIGENNEWLTSIKGQVQKLSKLTKELVFLSRMDEVDSVVAKSVFHLDQMVEDCVDAFKEAAKVAGKRFLLENSNLEIRANEEMLRRALGLILDNSIKYAEGEEIEIFVRKEGKKAVVEERNCTSLKKGIHPELFERFYRPDESRNSGTGGHGIGLSVVKSICEAHGGDAIAECDGEKITFRLSFPIL